MNNLLDFQKAIDEINHTVDEIRNKQIEVSDNELPTNLSIMLSGISNSNAVNFLFSNNVDKLIQRLFDLVISGDIDKILDNEESMKRIFSVLGFGEGAFEGKISRTVISTIKHSTHSASYNRTKNSLKKVMIVIDNLNRMKNTLIDPAERKKYEDAVYAVKKVIRFVGKIYKNRKIINNRVAAGLRNIVNEHELTESLIKIDFE
jgi:reverse gyrase